jgi:outer membrane protein TolC
MAILLAKENLSMLELFKDNLMQRSTSVAAAVSNGLMLQTNLDEIEVELLKTQQNLIEANENLNGLCASLTLMTGKEITPKTTLSVMPAGGSSIVMSIMRPETKLLLMQESLLDERYKLATNVALPKLYVGAAGNYGRPGPNFINQELRFFGSGTVSLRWNISTLYGLGREQRTFDLNKKMLEIQRDQLNKNIEISLSTYSSQLSALDQLMKLDALILAKKVEISAVSAAQLANGKITSTVYLIQLNDEMAARLNAKVHEIKRINAWSNYNITMGLINF